MKVNVTWSTEEEADIAGKQCAKKAVLDLMQTKLAVLFSSEKYDTKQLLDGAKTILGTAPIIGCTSSKGIATQGGYIISQNGFAGMMAIGDENTTVVTAGVENLSNAKETGKTAVKIAMKKINTNQKPNYLMMISSPGEEEEYLRGIKELIGNVPCFGGTCADDDMAGKWKIYTEDRIFSNGVAAALFYTDKKINNLIEHGYHETIKSGVITKTNGNREIVEINEIPALKKYSEWTDNRVKNLRGIKILEQSILKPFAVKTHDGKMSVIKQLLNGNTNYGINVSNDIAINTAIIQMHIEKNEIVKTPALSLRKIKNRDNDVAYLFFHSANRRDAINENINELVSNIKRESEEKPFLIGFTNGELGTSRDENNICTSLSETIIDFTK